MATDGEKAGNMTIGEMMQDPNARAMMFRIACRFAMKPVMDYIECITETPVFPDDAREPDVEVVSLLNAATRKVGRISIGVVDAGHTFSLEWFRSIPDGYETAIRTCTDISSSARLCTNLLVANTFAAELRVAGIDMTEFELHMDEDSTMFLKRYKNFHKRIGFIVSIDDISDEELERVMEHAKQRPPAK